ncbi:hypothetical protein ACFP2T_20400 [Plantactinospora solaniradicis]|uniref:Uncharacterized protein n=1 Tax=Plantactinospora solaniradicis TaxID=1723736 RepID=A0ABW1K9S6_9ACTN
MNLAAALVASLLVIPFPVAGTRSSAGSGPMAAVTVRPAPPTPAGASRRIIPGTPDQPSLRYVVDGASKPSGHRSAAYPVRVTLLDRRGVPAAPPEDEGDGYNRAFFLDLDTGALAGTATDGQTITLPTGSFLLVSAVRTPEPLSVGSRTVLVHPELVVTDRASVTLDARTARRVSVTVDRPTAERMGGSLGVVVRDFPDPRERIDFALPLDRYGEVYATSVPDVSNPRLTYYHREMLEEPELRLDVTAPERFSVRVQPYADGSRQVPRLLGSHPLSTVYGGAGTPAELATLPVRGRLVLLRLTGDEARNADLVAERIRNVASAGGRAVLLGGTVPDVSEASIPVAYTVDPALDRLVALAGTAQARVSWTELAASPYRYDAAFTNRGQVPARTGHRLRDGDLAAVRTTYHAQGGDGIGAELKLALLDGLELESVSVVPWPFTRTDYVTPGRWRSVQWNYEWGLDELYRETTSYTAGQTAVVDWNRAVLGPLPPRDPFDGAGWAYREQDLIRVRVPLFADSTGNIRPAVTAEPPEPLLRGITELYRDDVLVDRWDAVGYGDFAVPAEPGRYTLRAAAERISPLFTTSTSVAATWSFSSGRAAERTALPLLGVRARAEVDDRNRGPAGRAVRLRLDLSRAGTEGPVGTRVLTAQISTDEGRTWRVAPVRPDGTGWVASYVNPTTGDVSLRLSATDVDGNTVSTTILRAYPVG